MSSNKTVKPFFFGEWQNIKAINPSFICSNSDGNDDGMDALQLHRSLTKLSDPQGMLLPKCPFS